MLTLYKSMVRCRLEYCCPLWNPADIASIQAIESVQQHFTKRVSGFQHLSYYDQIKGLKLQSLQRRRERYIIIYMWKIRHSLTMMTLYKSMVRSIVEYCCPLWHPTGSGLTKKIEALQRSFTRRIQTCKNMDYWQRLSFLIKLMSLQRRRERYIIITMWKILNNYHPNNMKIQFQEPNRNGIMAKLPPLSKKCRTKHQTLYDSSFAVLGPKLWNNIPAKLTLIQDIDTFKTDLYNDYLHKIPDRPLLADTLVQPQTLYWNGVETKHHGVVRYADGPAMCTIEICR